MEKLKLRVIFLSMVGERKGIMKCEMEVPKDSLKLNEVQREELVLGHLTSSVGYYKKWNRCFMCSWREKDRNTGHCECPIRIIESKMI